MKSLHVMMNFNKTRDFVILVELLSQIDSIFNLLIWHVKRTLRTHERFSTNQSDVNLNTVYYIFSSL